MSRAIIMIYINITNFVAVKITVFGVSLNLFYKQPLNFLKQKRKTNLNSIQNNSIQNNNKLDVLVSPGVA